ncbi:MAG: CpsB/CapC family capsule biosynthesis tyrosine phosphatase [Gallionella sp.]|jgi:protein-tyrosine phosphatase
MIDLHCHYLPGIDDGSQSMAESLDLARASVEDGISHAVMTPHIHPGRYENTRTTVALAVERYREQLKLAGIPLQVYPGGEVRLSSDIIDLYEQGELPLLGTYNGFHVLLLEFPYGQIPVGSEKLVSWLLDRKIRPLIAHPERNKVVMRNADTLRPYVERGCLLQLTAASITGGFGLAVQDCARLLLDRRWASVVATDAHNLLHRRPVLSEARIFVSERYGSEYAEALTRAMPAKLLAIGRH